MSDLQHRDTEEDEKDERTSNFVHDELTERIIGCAIEVHRFLGPGLLESVYEDCLCRELQLAGLSFRRQLPADLIYKGVKLASQLRVDLVVEEKVLLELKSIERLMPIHRAQVLTYLRLTGLKTALLINFNSAVLIDGVKRISL